MADKKMDETELTEAQQEVLDALRTAYDRYTRLIKHIMDEVVDRDYTSVYAVKKALLTVISESLGER